MITSKIETISPLIAATMLERNPKNRHYKDSRSMGYSQQMKDGVWALNGEAIIISNESTLLDGQHRLHAVIKANMSIDMLVVRGVNADALDTIDTGDKRTPADVLTMNGYSGRESMMMARAVALEMGVRSGTTTLRPGDRRGKSLATPHHTLEVVKNDEGFYSAAHFISQFGTKTMPMSAASLTFLAYRFSKFDKDFAKDWLTGFITGANLSETEPRMRIREILWRNSNSAIKLMPNQQMMLVIKAWWHDRTGKIVRTNQAYRIANIQDAIKFILLESDNQGAE